MKRKEFLKTSAAIFTGGMFLPMLSCEEASKAVRSNWAGNYFYKAENLYEPATLEEVKDLVKKPGQQKALGSRHCFNNIADSPLSQVSTKKLNKIIAVDSDTGTVTVESGIRYGELAPVLEAQGYALHNLASLPHISVAGACATATHGSGVNNGNLATAVTALELITADGSVLNIDKSQPEFNGCVVNLGALGIITKLTLAIQDTYALRQDLFQNLPLAEVRDHFDAIMSSGYSVSLFTDWQDEIVSQVWIKRRTDDTPHDMGNEFYGGTAARENLHPITRLSAVNCTDQMGVEGPWYDRLPHFKMGFTPSSGKELQSEYFVPRDMAVEALLAIEKLKDRIYPHLEISEIRTIASDNFWLSPCYQKDCVAFHFTWKQHLDEVSKLLPQIEAELSPYDVVPHWGKLFTIKPDILHQRYKRMDDFLALAGKYDPDGKFSNAYLKTNIYTS